MLSRQPNWKPRLILKTYRNWPWAKIQHVKNISVNHPLLRDLLYRNVSDLGVVVDLQLRFNEHIATVTCNVHQRANLIQRCFTSKNSDLLITALKTYSRPILEFNSPVWSPRLMKNILQIESIQRKLTKRMPGLSGLTYYSRQQTLNLQSLEVRRLRADMLLVCKVILGLVHINSNTLFTSRNPPHLWGHKYVIIVKQHSVSSIRESFFSVTEWLIYWTVY